MKFSNLKIDYDTHDEYSFIEQTDAAANAALEKFENNFRSIWKSNKNLWLSEKATDNLYKSETKINAAELKERGITRFQFNKPFVDTLMSDLDETIQRLDEQRAAHALNELAVGGASIVIGKQCSKICHANENILTQVEEIKDPLNIFKSKAISFTIFARFSDINQLGPAFFDEKLGVGAGTKWGSGEETDFLIRAHRLGITIFKQPAIEIFHPVKISSPRRCLHYGLGRYKVIKKNDLGCIIYAINVLQPLIRLFLKSEYRFLLSHICTALGRSGLPLLFSNFWIR